MAGGWVGIGSPIVTLLMVLVPVIIILVSLHKISEARESAGTFLIEMLFRAGGSFLVILLLRTIFGI